MVSIALIFILMDEADVSVRPLGARTEYIQQNVWLMVKKYDE